MKNETRTELMAIPIVAIVFVVGFVLFIARWQGVWAWLLSARPAWPGRDPDRAATRGAIRIRPLRRRPPEPLAPRRRPTTSTGCS